MNDTDKYPLFEVKNKKLVKLNTKKFIIGYQYHHYIRKKDLKRDKLWFIDKGLYPSKQKLILMPAEMNYNLESMGEGTFYKKYGIDKNILVFSRKKYREGFYDNKE